MKTNHDEFPASSKMLDRQFMKKKPNKEGILGKCKNRLQWGGFGGGKQRRLKRSRKQKREGGGRGDVGRA